jgi:hypothetical protein
MVNDPFIHLLYCNIIYQFRKGELIPANNTGVALKWLYRKHENSNGMDTINKNESIIDKHI